MISVLQALQRASGIQPVLAVGVAVAVAWVAVAVAGVAAVAVGLVALAAGPGVRVAGPEALVLLAVEPVLGARAA